VSFDSVGHRVGSVAFAVSFVLVLAAAVSIAAEGAPPAFDYDRATPLDVREGKATRPPGEVLVRDLTYLRLSGGRNGATLVSPRTPPRGLRPALLFVHWYGPESPTSNRGQFLEEAIGLARSGAVSLLVDTMWSDPKWFPSRTPADDLPNSIAQVKELRRALDVLTARPGVDPKRVAYVGHDFGAMYGALLGGSDGRPAVYVLMAGTKSFSDWFLLGRKLQGEAREAVVRELSVLDPARHVGAVAPAPVLFQFARKDHFVPEADAQAFFAGAREPKELRWYDAGHGLNDEAAHDRVAWLKAKLGL